MRRRLIPVLILAERFLIHVVTSFLDATLHKWLQSAQSGLGWEYQFVEYVSCAYHARTGVDLPIIDFRPGTDEGAEAGGTFR